jgi:hypothetical protein
MELLCRFFAERIADEFLVAFGTQVVAKILIGRLQILGVDIAVFHLAEELADGFHVVGVEIGFGQFRRILGGENLHFYDKVAIVAGLQLPTTEITRDMQHKRVTLPSARSKSVGETSFTGSRFIASPACGPACAERLPLHPSVAGFRLPVKLNLRKVVDLPDIPRRAIRRLLPS